MDRETKKEFFCIFCIFSHKSKKRKRKKMAQPPAERSGRAGPTADALSRVLHNVVSMAVMGAMARALHSPVADALPEDLHEALELWRHYFPAVLADGPAAAAAAAPMPAVELRGASGSGSGGSKRPAAAESECESESESDSESDSEAEADAESVRPKKQDQKQKPKPKRRKSSRRSPVPAVPPPLTPPKSLQRDPAAANVLALLVQAVGGEARFPTEVRVAEWRLVQEQSGQWRMARRVQGGKVFYFKRRHHMGGTVPFCQDCGERVKRGDYTAHIGTHKDRRYIHLQCLWAHEAAGEWVGP